MPLIIYLPLNLVEWTTSACLFTVLTLGGTVTLLLLIFSMFFVQLLDKFQFFLKSLNYDVKKQTNKQKIILFCVLMQLPMDSTISAWPPILHKAQWIPRLLTSVSSCLCNAADTQQCIVMPGCPSTLIPFKAHPTGWHQGVGSCSKVWQLLKQLGKLANLP